MRVAGSIAPDVRGHGPLKLLRGVLASKDDRLLAGLDADGKRLGHIDEHAQHVGLDEREQLAIGRGVVGHDQAADVEVALGDDAAEGGEHLLIRRQLFEAAGRWPRSPRSSLRPA